MKLFFLISFVLITVPNFQNTKEKIRWEENKKLTWSDFKGSPKNVSSFVASTNSGISLSFSVTTSNGDTKVDYTVASYFYPNESWYKPDTVNPQILAHEQTHFDISELFARKLKEKFSRIQKDSNFKSEAEVVYKQNEKDRVEMQDRFDEETNHSRIDKKEVAWELYIKEQLQVYNDWK
jgi:hypothetical protein